MSDILYRHFDTQSFEGHMTPYFHISFRDDGLPVATTPATAVAAATLLAAGALHGIEVRLHSSHRRVHHADRHHLAQHRVGLSEVLGPILDHS